MLITIQPHTQTSISYSLYEVAAKTLHAFLVIFFKWQRLV